MNPHQSAKRPPVTRFTMKRTVTLSSHQAMQIAHRFYEPTKSFLWQVEVLAASIDHALTPDIASAMVTRVMDDYQRRVQDEAERLRSGLEANGMDPNALAEPEQTQRVTFSITTPLISRWVALLIQFDQLNQLMDTAWLTGVCSSSWRKHESYAFRKGMGHVTGRIRQISERLKRIPKGMDPNWQELGYMPDEELDVLLSRQESARAAEADAEPEDQAAVAR